MESVLSFLMSLMCVSKADESTSKAGQSKGLSLKGSRELGSGNFGTVYKVGKKAVKVVSCWNEADMEDVREEWITMNRAAEVSRNVMKAAFHTGTGCCSLVMEACKGTVLDWMNTVKLRKIPGHFLTRGATSLGPSERQTLELFEQMVAGVACCHYQGIAHCDVKPENFLLTELPATSRSHIRPGTVKLTDFGFARRMLECKLTVVTCGTEEYVAPEVVSHGLGGRQADVWGLGVCLLRMLDGDMSKDLVQLYSEFNTNAGFWSRVSKSLLCRMLVTDPEARIHSFHLHRLLTQHPLLQKAHKGNGECARRRGGRVAPVSAH